MKNSLFNLKDKIKDIIEDRYPGKLSLGELENISDRVITEESFSKLSNVSKLSLEILWLMNGQNGQILRFIFSNYDYVGAGYLKKIYKWSTSFLDTDFQIDSIDSMEVPDFFIDLADRDEIKVRDVIERIFICKTKEVDFYKEKENKVNLFEKQNLSVDSIKTIIQETGTVPLNNTYETTPKEWIENLNIDALNWDNKTWKEHLKGTTLKRIKPWMWRRNIKANLENN